MTNALKRWVIVVLSLITQLTPAISQVRLEAHRPIGGSDLEMLTNYYWNISLCKALYLAIHALEISLRNSIHHAATAHYWTPFWFDHEGVLKDQQIERVQAARSELTLKGKPQTPDDIVAQLMFGFWVSLFNSPYEWSPPPAPADRLAWHDVANQPSHLFQQVFPNVPNAMRSRKKVSGRFNKVLQFRNRIMHHETIWKYPDLHSRHAEIISMIGWINPTMRQTIAFCDDFPTVYAGEKVAIEAKLRAYLSR
jgi:hypothetical protein